VKDCFNMRDMVKGMMIERINERDGKAIREERR
jgi:hypothetical protein